MLANDPKRLKAFFGLLSLQKRTNRRIYVVYTFVFSFLCLAALPVFRNSPWLAVYAFLIAPGTLTLFSQRGIQRGPIKSFTGEWRVIGFYPDRWKFRGQISRDANVSAWRNPDYTPGLDECETLDRNRAHYLSYRILRYVLPIAVVVYSIVLYFLRHMYSSILFFISVASLWALVVFTVNLPYAYILWTEPDVHFDLDQRIPSETTISFGS